MSNYDYDDYDDGLDGNTYEYEDYYDYDDEDESNYDDYDDHSSKPPDEQGIFHKKFDWGSLALSQYYNKQEKKSTFDDITVKVRTQIYHLNKVVLALKSAYFETLFTGDFEDRKYDEIEIHMIDEETFSSIVDYIYGADLRYEVLNEHNFAAVFMAMDYLQMEIDLRIFINFLSRNYKLDDKVVFQLYNFVSLLSEFEPITTAIHQRFAKNLKKISNSSEFLSISLAALIEVLNADICGRGDANYDTSLEMHKINEILDEIDGSCDGDSDTSLETNNMNEICDYVEICAEWICYDFQKRLPHIIDIVNAFTRIYKNNFEISDANYRPFEEPDETKRKKRVKKYLNRLMNHSVEIKPESGQTSQQSAPGVIKGRKSEYPVVNKIDYAAKWKTYFEQENFCDVAIRVEDEIFQLHRIQLSLEIPYFHDFFLRSPNQNEHELEAAVDGATFKKIISFLYYEKIDLTNERQIVRLLRGCAILRIGGLKNEVYQYVKNNLNIMKGIFDFLYFTVENEEFHEHLDELETFIGVSWEKICQEPEFCETSIDVLEYVINLPNLRLKNEHDLLNICSKWIHYDVKNRHQFIPKLALAINRCLEVALKKSDPIQLEELCSRQQIEDHLKNILSSMQLVSTGTSSLACDFPEELIPCFLILKDEEISIVNGEFDEITRISLLYTIQEEICEYELSGAIVNENLFMLFASENKFSFIVYNIRSKKVTSLTFKFEMISSNFHLINHNNELYFYSDEEDYIWKYSGQMNRWIRLFNIEGKHSQFITSDGKNLYRILKNNPYKSDGEVQQYKFKKQSWVKYEHLPLGSYNHGRIQNVSFFDENFLIFFERRTVLYRQELREWKFITHGDNNFTNFKRIKDSIIYISEIDSLETGEKDSIEFHSFSIADEQWQLKKKIQMKYKKIVPVHSV